MLKNIVVFGGGSGLSNLVAGLRPFNLNIKAVVSVADDGGSTGLIRQSVTIPAVGDFRKVLSALTCKEMADILNYRFLNPLFKDHPLGNIIMLALYEYSGYDFSYVTNKMNQYFLKNNEVLPVTYDSVILKAETEKGPCYGEELIHNFEGAILKLENVPKSEVNKAVLEAILEADMIIYAPGSLYTSILAVLCYEELVLTLSKSQALKVYIANLFEDKNETLGMNLDSHIKALEAVIGKNNLDVVIANNDISICDDNILKGRKFIKPETKFKGFYQFYFDKYYEITDGILRHDLLKIGKFLSELKRGD